MPEEAIEDGTYDVQIVWSNDVKVQMRLTTEQLVSIRDNMSQGYSYYVNGIILGLRDVAMIVVATP